jgi:UDP-N-acetylmuramoylalanine--D-glutamate ligase
VRSSDLAGRRIAILGTGREGAAALEALRGVAASIVATTDGEAPEWDVPVLVRPGADDLDVDVVIKSPGITPRHPLVAALADRGVPISSGTDLWMGEHAGRTIGVTGSKGKSTTSSIAHALLPGSGYGGNIGLPLLAMSEADLFVVELSSYQCQSLTVSPDVAVVTSLFSEHLDWHGSTEQYFTDKLNIVRHEPRVVVANGEDADVREWLARSYPTELVRWVGGEEGYRLEERDGATWLFRDGEFLLPASELQVRGRHNALNALLALAAGDAAVERDSTLERDGNGRLPADAVAERLRAFRPLEHRLEPIADPSGVTFVDDSLSTSPFAAIEALKAFPGEDVVLLVGGQDRGVDYSPLAEYLAQHPIARVIGLPESGARILTELPGVTEMSDGMVDAVRRARAVGAATVLMSPAAPSYGIYRDFAERAAHFRTAIEETR